MREGDAPLDKVKIFQSPPLLCVAQLFCQEKYKVHNITVVRIAEFINTVVGTRKTNNNIGVVVMKLDVEVKIQFR